jgi:CBS-domain-containing membrane protein
MPRRVKRLAAWLARLLQRQEPPVSFRLTCKHALGAFGAILLLGLLLDRTGLPLLIAPFGASTLLIFGRPSSPLAQPVNIVCGYGIGASTGFVSAMLFPGILPATAVSLGLALMLMSFFRVTHPPAGAIPLITFADPIGVLAVIEAVAVGATTLVLLGLVYHRIPPCQTYPCRGAPPPAGLR